MPTAALTLLKHSSSHDAFFDLPVGLLCIVGFDRVIQRVNAGWMQAFGWPEEEVVGQDFLGLIHPDDVDSARSEHAANESGSASTCYECRIRCKDGSYRIVQWSSAPSLDEGVIYAMGWDVTEMRQKERRLRLLETVAVTTNDGVLIAEAPDRAEQDAILVYVNDALVRASGYAEAELIGQPTTILTDPGADIERQTANRTRLMADGEITGRTELRRKDGTTIWVDYSTRAVPAPDEHRTIWVSILRDVTERVLAERALAETSERYQILFESNPAPMWVFDVETLRFLAVNEAATVQYGYTREQFLSMTIRDIRPPEDIPSLERSVREGHGSIRLSGVWTHRHADGSKHLVRITTHGLEFLGRDAVLVLAFDVTETVQAQSQLRENNQLLRGIIDSSPLAIVTLDSQGVVRTWNPAAERILGRTNDQAVGHPLEDVITGSTKTLAEFRDRLHRKQPFTDFETSLRRRGERVDISVALSLLDGDAEDGAEMIAVIADISDRKQAERALRELNKRLEDRVTERTVALTSANKELEAFCFSVSHDLRGPLRSIDGFSRAIIEDYGDKLDETGVDYLNRVRTATQRLGSLMDSLLALSRLTRTPMTAEDLDLSAMAQEAIAELAARDPDRHVTVSVQPGVRAQGDPRLLRLVIDNLLDNAWKFTSRREHASIGFGAEDQDGEIVYRVSDNGEGFDMKYVQKLFLPFERLHSNRDFPGNGIGLATVERIVARHGGRVWAKGADGEGATFYFTLHRGLSQA